MNPYNYVCMLQMQTFVDFYICDAVYSRKIANIKTSRKLPDLQYYCSNGKEDRGLHADLVWNKRSSCLEEIKRSRIPNFPK